MDTASGELDEIGLWARPTGTVHAPVTPARILNINVDSRDVTGPLQGFGPMRHKTYSTELAPGITPAEVMAVWKARFPQFWPPGNEIYVAPGGIAPGKVGVINLPAPFMPIKLATGILVLYADETSFTFITVQGHMFAGINNFSSYVSNGVTHAQIEVLLRTSDPLWEVSMRMFGFRREDEFWKATLTSLAGYFGLAAHPVMKSSILDHGLQWLRVLNVRYNAAILSGLYQMVPGWPRVARLFGL